MIARAGVLRNRYGIVAGALCLMTAHYVWYVHVTSANIVFQDHINLITKVDRYVAGQLRWSDIWILYDDAPYLVHRMPAMILLTLANATLWHWNTRAELFLGALWLPGIVTALFVMFRATLADRAGDLTIQLLFLPIVLIVFSLTQWENFLLTVALYAAIQSFVFALCVLAIWRGTAAPSAGRAVIAVALTCAALLLVSSGYSLPFGLAILVTLAHHWWRQRHARTPHWPILVTAGAVVICFVVYLHGIELWSSRIQASATDAVETAGLSNAPMLMVRSVLTVLMTSLVSNGWLVHQPAALQVAAGALVLGFLLYGLVAARQVEATRSFAPLLLIVFSLILAAGICFGRGGGGLAYLASSRYVTHVSLGVVGALWSVALAARSGRSVRGAAVHSAVWGAFVLMVLAGQALTLSQEWTASPYRRQYYESLQAMALYPDEFDEADFRRFQTSRTRDELIERLGRVRHLGLNVFHDPPHPGTNLDTAMRLRGWHDAEPGGRWMAEAALLLIESGDTGVLHLGGRTPSDRYASSIQVIVDGAPAAVARVVNNRLALEVPVGRRRLLLISLVPDRVVVPAESGGGDRRRLSVFVERLEAP